MMMDTLLALTRLQPLPRAVTPILEQRKNQLAALLPGFDKAETSDIFAVNFFQDYFIDSLKKEAAAIFAKAGRVVSVGAMQPLNDLRGKFMIHCDWQDVEVFFTLTPENPPLIQEYRIRLVGR